MTLARSAIRVATLVVVGCAAATLQFVTRSWVGLATWAWILSILQLVGVWSVSRRRPTGWLIGSAVQTSWAMYGALTAQAAFIFGCLISLTIQGYAWLRWSRRDGQQEEVR